MLNKMIRAIGFCVLTGCLTFVWSASSYAGSVEVGLHRTKIDNMPSRTADHKMLVVITHGINSDADGWVDDAASKMADAWVQAHQGTNAPDRIGLDIWEYDWREDASLQLDLTEVFSGEPRFRNVALNRVMNDVNRHAFKLAQQIAIRDYDYVEFIGHSMGGHLAIRAGTLLAFDDNPPRTVQTTMLDPYVDPNRDYSANDKVLAYSYFNSGDVPYTNEPAPGAVNFSLDELATGLLPPIFDHDFSHEWYVDKTISAETIINARRTSDFSPGFALSLPALKFGGWNPAQIHGRYDRDVTHVIVPTPSAFVAGLGLMALATFRRRRQAI